MQIKIGTRSSKLALKQTELVVNALKEIDKTIEVEIIKIKTKGDLVLDKSLDKLGDKGLFVSEISNKIAKSEIDIAVHSFKDLPIDNIYGTEILPVLKRGSANDVLVVKNEFTNISALEGKLIATGSKRRKLQLLQLIPDVRVVDIRGNINTRINKIDSENLDGIVLAAAGVERLDIVNDEKNVIKLDYSKMIPAPAQGVIAVEFLSTNNTIRELLIKLCDQGTVLSTLVEREYLKEVGGGCHLPVGAFLEDCEDCFKFYYLFGNESLDIFYQGIEVIDKANPVIEDVLLQLAKKCALKAKLECK